jgi:hypothetical protein
MGCKASVIQRRQAREWKAPCRMEIFAKYWSDRRVISRTYKELKELNTKTIDHLTSKHIN